MFGGGPLLAYAIAIFIRGTAHRADMLREATALWLAGMPVLMVLTGASLGFFFARIAQARAHAPFLKALPLSSRERARSAAIAAVVLGAPLVILDAAAIGGIALLIEKPLPLLWLGIALVAAAAGFAAAMRLQLRRPYQPPTALAAAEDAATRGVSVGRIDRRPRWLGAWAGELPAGRVRPSPRLVLLGVVFGFAGLGAIVTSFVRGTAAAGALVGVVGGLFLFMMALRMRPLLSPVLTASRLPFLRAWLSLMRLPLIVSAGFFGLTALPAYAAEPGAWEVPLAGLMGLVALNFIYAVFAAFFAAAPKLAAFAFVAALALTFYESLEYSRTVVLGLLALLVFVFIRTRQRYRHG